MAQHLKPQEKATHQHREKMIMNAFVIFCVTLGFFSLASVYLPAQVSEANSKHGEAGMLGMIKSTESDLSSENMGQSLGRRQSKYHKNSKKSDAKKLPSWLTVPQELAADVAFWRDIYATYTSAQTVFHDKKHLNIIYHVEDFSKLEKNSHLSSLEKIKLRETMEENIKKTIAAHLDELASKTSSKGLSSSEQKWWKYFHAFPNGFAEAKDRIRGQSGLRDRFEEGLQYSGRYLNEIEQLFSQAGMPTELTRLIFVESLFNPQAHSSVGARGVWQFMRDAGKHYKLKVNEAIDERADPLKATLAAARLLKDNYNYLGSWPLAINAYNAGRGRLKQACDQLGTKDIARIIREFESPAYGFASRNFYLEFLAAYEVVENQDFYFDNLQKHEPLPHELVTVSLSISLPKAAEQSKITLEELATLNPALSTKVFKGQILLPAGTELRLPMGSSERFMRFVAMQKDGKKKRA